VRKKVEVSNDELRTIRDAMRDLNRMIERLENGHSEKFVLTKHGQMRAVVLSLDYFTSICPASAGQSHGANGAAADAPTTGSADACLT
jgi:hypothetical protein